MKRIVLWIILLMCFSVNLKAQNIYELRKLTEDDWLEMSTDERIRALGTAYKHERNQTFLGNFGRHYDLYRRWGYEYYEMENRYESYAFRNFEAYNVLEERRRKWSYNEFGDRITKMGHRANIWKEISFGDGQYHVYIPFDYINTVFWFSEFSDGVWVAKESTDDWAISVIGAGALRTKFTPLTLSMPAINGMAVDFQSANTSIKFVNSALIGAFRSSDIEGSIRGLMAEDSDLVKRGGVMLRGGRFRRKLGALTLGATYVNAYGVQGNRERGSEWRGTVNNFTPTPIMVAVRFLDDSPEDGEGGPVVYDVRIKINGRNRDDIVPQIILDDVTYDRTTAITSKFQNKYLEPSVDAPWTGTSFPEYDFLNTSSSLTKYGDYFYLNDLIKGYNSENVKINFSKNLANAYYSLAEQGGKPIHVNGTETVVYLFDLKSFTDKINRIEAVTTVANDYRIQTSMIYTFDPTGGHDPQGKTTSWYDATYWRTAAQAEGNIKDGSNVRTIKLDFGYQVASIIYGFDADFNYLGFKIKGEYVTNSNHYMFADGTAGTGNPSNIISGQSPRTGHRWSQIDHAYYVTTEKDWNKFGFSGEIFKMGKFYRPYFDCFYPTAPHIPATWSVTNRNSITRISLVEDNDDDDFYPDTMTILRFRDFTVYDMEDPDGVFPGNDEDNDELPDNNRNNNRIPDYDEPFLMFDVDPDDFVFGNDYNNNTIPDFREDDLKMDTPYDLDRQGHHFFLRYTPQQNINFIAGSLKARGVGTSGRTNEDYFKFLLNYDVFDIGKMYAEYRFEKKQDNIRDPYVQVETRMNEKYVSTGGWTTSRFNRDLYYDELEYRNSSVNRLFLDSKIRAFPSVTLENHVKFERNNQIEGTMYDKIFQPHDVLTTLAMVNKIVYTKRWGNLMFSPGVKFRFYKKARSESLQPLDHYMMRIPLVMFKYIISPDTDISLGMQGIPGFQFQYKDYVQSHNDYRKKTYTLQLQNRTGYFGYNVWAAAGVTLDQIMYYEAYRHYEEYKSSTTFVKVYLGW